MAGSVGPAGACELLPFVRLVDNRVGAMRLDGAEAVPFSVRGSLGGRRAGVLFWLFSEGRVLIC